MVIMLNVLYYLVREKEASHGGESIEPGPAKKVVLDLFLEAWEKAMEAGIDTDLPCEVMVYMVITDLVADRGEDWTAEAFEDLSERIREGEFTLPEEITESHSYEVPNPIHA